MCCCEWTDLAPRLAAIARREGASAVDALDLVQDAFFTLLARPDGPTLARDDAARLLSTIVKNAARNHRRRHHRARPHVDVDGATLATETPPPDAALARAVELAQLGGCMAQLGDAHRHVITLRILDELSGDEVARELGLTTGHVAVLLHRARKALAECMLTAR